MALPQPINTTDEYLAAIHDRLGEVLDRLPAKPEPQPEPAAGPVELREPAQTPAARPKPARPAPRKRTPKEST